MTPQDRHCDLMRQGFMKPTKVRRVKPQRPVVACDRCMDWHPKGQHRKAQVQP